MPQTKEDLETWYFNKDPWGYTTNEDDKIRKQKILDALNPHAPFERALDIGCGEGFITQDLPARFKEGIEISDTAAKRLPDQVKRVINPTGEYDLIICTGMLYNQYDHHTFLSWMRSHIAPGGIILTCNIQDWEINTLPSEYQTHEVEFSYRTYTQKLRVYKWPE